MKHTFNALRWKNTTIYHKSEKFTATKRDVFLTDPQEETSTYLSCMIMIPMPLCLMH